jgi:hypothetical protein
VAFPLINCVIDFSVDGVVFAHQPFSLDLEEAEARLTQTGRGYVIPATRQGRRVRVTWGERVATEAAVKELRDAFGTTLSHTFAWTDPDGTAETIDIALDSYETQWNWSEPGFYQPVEVLAHERAPRRVGAGDLYVAQNAGAVNRYARRVAGVWVQKDFPDVPPARTAHLRYFGNNILAHAFYDGGNFGPAPRASFDKGETWADLAHPDVPSRVRGVEQAADGRWWAYTQDTLNRVMAMYVSTNQGTSWTFSGSASGFPLAGGAAGGIAVHPTDPLKIIGAFNEASAAQRFLRTLDGGASWVTVFPVGLSSTIQTDMLWLASGRIVCVYDRIGGSGAQIAYSDDNGANWTVAVSPALDNGEHSLILRSDIADTALWVWIEPNTGLQNLYRSTDNGTTWLAPVSLPDLNQRGLAYDAATDTLYLVERFSGNVYSLTRAKVRTDWATLTAASWTTVLPALGGIDGQNVDMVIVLPADP